MTFKHKGKDNLSVTGFGIAFSAASTLMPLISGFAASAVSSVPGALSNFFAQMATGQFAIALLMSLVMGFVAGALIAIIYNALLKTKFGSKY